MASEVEARPLARRQGLDPAQLRTVVLHGDSARSQSQRAYLLIRDQIVTLKLAPGSVIEEARLREDLHLGRTPIREALQRLAHENLVSFVPHRGTFVTDINIQDLGHLTEVRTELEGYAARLAAERASVAERGAMGALLTELRSTQSAGPLALMQLDQKIHRQIYRATRNGFLAGVLEQYFNLTLRLWFLVLDRGVHLREAVQEHREALEAIVGREAATAEAIMRRHVVGFEQEVRRVL
ncbi:MAG TPA: GntR family transcriptional regulator [Candidatus Limnocylindrales bacterium]|nr:GntR family transcriptional regulator [Candidatus Limnocylindrales bacterium]